MERMYGYIRVSTKDQHEDRQLLAMKEFGVAEKAVYMDKLSGKDFERPQYRRLMKKLKPGDLTGTFVADLVLQILCYVAQIERENIRQRQAEGIVAAKAKGVRFGRRKLPIPDGFYLLQREYQSGKETARSAAQKLGVAHSTFLKWNRMVQCMEKEG